ncbi:MAG TPA: DUF3795 domain-containing protein [Caldisericia bacterium]|nr:DUF3795 domain-containing protein [Caldisericia bacterium]
MSKISYCGLDCEICPAFIATRDGNADLLEETAQRWSELYHCTMTPKDVLCGGCTSGSGIVNCHWHECEIRICAEDKKVENCGKCEKYSCETIQALTDLVPEAKEKLDHIHSEK